MNPRRFVGVDQTGAATRRGRAAKPLPCAVVEREGSRWVVRTRSGARWLALPSLTPEALTARGWFGPELVLLVDAVFGLPAGAHAPADPEAWMWARFADAAAHHHDGRMFGRAVAADFFDQLRAGRPDLRVVDTLVGAQSVFVGVPYQRDVRTGTYRVWRDLGVVGRMWASVWPFSEAPGRPAIAEAWPTWGWRHLLGSSSRDPARLRAWLGAHDELAVADDLHDLETHPDHADALVNALVGWHHHRTGTPWAAGGPGWCRARDSGEGWVVGASEDGV